MKNIENILKKMRVVSWKGYVGTGEFTIFKAHSIPKEQRYTLENRWGVEIFSHKDGDLFVLSERPTTYEEWLSQHGNPTDGLVAVANTDDHINYSPSIDRLELRNGELWLVSFEANGWGQYDGSYTVKSTETKVAAA